MARDHPARRRLQRGGRNVEPDVDGGSPSIAAASPTAAPSPSATAAPTASPSPSPSGPFTSATYGYTVNAPGWTGAQASAAWDGTGSPGDGDPFVDTFAGPRMKAFAVGVATKQKLKALIAAQRKAGEAVHPCSGTPEEVATSIDGADGELDAVTCETPSGDIFVMTATVIQNGRAFVFVTYGQASNEAVMRDGFATFLEGVSLPS